MRPLAAVRALTGGSPDRDTERTPNDHTGARRQAAHGYNGILTADHGGHVDGHGTSDPVDVTIPWVIAGPHTAKGKVLSSAIRTVDTAAGPVRVFLGGERLSWSAGAQGQK